jgi:hypothetical protein
MAQDGDQARRPAAARWRIHILSDPPRRFRVGEAVPPEGWAVQEETHVFRDGEAVGLFAGLISTEAGQWNLRYEWVG